MITNPRFTFEPAVLPPESFDPEHYMSRGIAPDVAAAVVRDMKHQRVFMSSEFQVNVRKVAITDWPPMLHLSVKRRDRAVIHDWRDLQRIKNAIVGPEHEAVELYPAESRLVDGANQFHLWVLAERGVRFPFGFDERLVDDCTYASVLGSVQRPFTK